MKQIGIAVTYSLSTSICINMECFKEEMDIWDVPIYLLPNPTSKGTLTITKMRKFLSAVFSVCRSVSLRKNGGVEFIPMGDVDFWESVENLLDRFEGIEITKVAVFDDELTSASIKSSLCREINEFCLTEKRDNFMDFTIYLLDYKVKKIRVVVDKAKLYEELIDFSLGRDAKNLVELFYEVKGSLEQKIEDKEYDEMFDS